ncbi:MAG TPA: hypothetical protein VE870_07785, partial [Bacteroidales bacterium]|nr:hypothetical protein [Bacteroidales bacterium]
MRHKVLLFNALLLIVAVGPANLSAQTFSGDKRVEKTFKAAPGATIEVDNKYGKIHVIPWPKDSVKFIAEAAISSNNLSRLQKIKSNIQFHFSSSDYYITASTDFGNTGNQIFAELKNISDNLITGKNSIAINYTIYCPEKINLSLINKFGDIYMDDITGRVKVSLSNGDIKVNSIKGEAQIEINFGTGVINNLTEGRLTAAYSDLMIRNAGNLTVNSKSSTININKAVLVKTDSRRDKMFITDVEHLYGSSEFSQIWVDNLRCEATLDLKFGNLTVDKIRQDFCKIDISSEYADINLRIEQGTHYHSDLYYKEDAYVTFPGNGDETTVTTEESSPG